MRYGHTLVELMVVLALAGLVAGAAAQLLHSQNVLARRTMERARQSESIRTTARVLLAETRWLNSERDVHSIAGDSLALRAFRGIAAVCASLANGTLVRMRGVRQPDPLKDSLLILRDTSFERAAALTAAVEATGGCSASPDETIQRITTPEPLQLGDVIAFFETGTYYLSGNALRYRLGREGRQPVTTELFDDRNTGFGWDSRAAIATLTTRADANRSRWQERVRLAFAESPR